MSHDVYKRSCLSRWGDRLVKQLLIKSQHKITPDLFWCCYFAFSWLHRLDRQPVGLDAALNVRCQFLWRGYLCSSPTFSNLWLPPCWSCSGLIQLQYNIFEQETGSLHWWFQSFSQCCLFAPDLAVFLCHLAERHFPSEVKVLCPAPTLGSTTKATLCSRATNVKLLSLIGAWGNWVTIEKCL